MREITQEMKEGFQFLFDKSMKKSFIRAALINAYNPNLCNVDMRTLYRYMSSEPDGGKNYKNALHQLETANINGIETQEIIGEDRMEILLEMHDNKE